MGVYTRLGMEDLAGAVNNLPELRLVSPPTAVEPPAPSDSAGEAPHDPDLNRLVASWPRLSDPLRKAILAILGSAELTPPTPSS